MKKSIYKVFKPVGTVFICLLFFSTAQAQYLRNCDTIYYRAPKQLRDTVLQYTNHFYFTVEVGFGFNLGPTTTITGNDRFETNAAPFDLYDWSMISPTKFNVGYMYKNHYFEGSFGMLRERMNISILDDAGNRMIDYRRAQTYHSFTLRYFYAFPYNIPRLKLMLGAEVGGAYRPDGGLQESSSTVFRDPNYGITAGIRAQNNFQLILGVSTRMDIKLCKNLSLNLLATLIGSPLRGTEYTFVYSYPGSPDNVAQAYASLLNVNLNAGLTLDLYCHKDKRKTYDYYDIGDPYRDK
jgi:hypothetical protein